ncbi:hypothetical protein ACIHCM_10620 [Streptomyces sp. NPDC052023]|uniref:hypothetical protein n=1 Tax=Streptomyces sp. NPDC052023 TaxID=3365681 RepID=UPI0037D62395
MTTRPSRRSSAAIGVHLLTEEEGPDRARGRGLAYTLDHREIHDGSHPTTP